MKFYKLKYFEESEYGNPSIQDFRCGYDSDAENSASHIRFYEKINGIPDLDFILDSNGKATDLLEVCHVGSDYLCVTPQFYNILKTHKLLPHQLFEVIIRDKVNLLPYHFIHFYDRFDSDENDIVDFKKTKFYAEKTTYPVSIMAVVPTEGEGVLGEFQVNSWNEYHKIREKVENDSVHKVILPLNILYIKKKEFLEFDLFYLGFNNFEMHEFVVSERLANIIKENKMTGLHLDPLPFELEPS